MQSELELVESELQDLFVMLTNVDDEIKAVILTIKDVEDNIRALDAFISDKSVSVEDRQGFRDEKKQLRDKEKQLRDEKKQLRDKEKQLRDEKKQLREDKRKFETMMTSTVESFNLLVLTEELVKTHSDQASASSFALRDFAAGFGFLPSSYLFDPTSDSRVWSRLVPHPNPLPLSPAASGTGTISDFISLPVLGEKGDLLYQGEDETHGVRYILDHTLPSSFSNLISVGSTLNTNGLNGGIVSGQSKPDFMWSRSGVAFGVLEVKGGSSSVLPAIRQAALTGTNVAVNLLRRGLSPRDVVVPVAGSTGRLMQFGAVIVLEPSLPTFIPTSRILDLSSDESNALACAYLKRASEHVDTMFAALNSLYAAQSPRDVINMYLDCTKVHIKKLTHEILDRGLGLFSITDSPDVLDVGPGLLHMGRVLNKLFAHEHARGVAVFPLTIRSPDVSSTDALSSQGALSANNVYWLIYDNLTFQGFRIGTPNRRTEEDLYQRFLGALEAAIGHVHDAGVIHCDLYPSNIMWKQQQQQLGGGDGGVHVVIRLIDWDCAHCLDEGSFKGQVMSRVDSHRPKAEGESARFDASYDWRYFAVYVGEIMRDEEDEDGEEEDALWDDLASNNKAKIDNAYFKLFQRESAQKKVNARGLGQSSK